MQQIINITQVRNNLSRLVKEVSREDKTVVIIRDSQPEAAIIPYSRVKIMDAEIDKKRKQQFSKVFSAIRKQGRAWLKKKGVNWKKMTEEEFYDFIDKI